MASRASLWGQRRGGLSRLRWASLRPPRKDRIQKTRQNGKQKMKKRARKIYNSLTRKRRKGLLITSLLKDKKVHYSGGNSGQASLLFGGRCVRVSRCPMGQRVRRCGAAWRGVSCGAVRRASGKRAARATGPSPVRAAKEVCFSPLYRVSTARCARWAANRALVWVCFLPYIAITPGPTGRYAPSGCLAARGAHGRLLFGVSRPEDRRQSRLWAMNLASGGHI